MDNQAVIYAWGRDRIGVAADLATALTSRGLAIEQSRMTALAGRFALIVRVQGTDERLASLRRDLGPLGAALGFDLHVESVQPVSSRSGERHFRIECFSERPAEISAVTGMLKRLDINVEDLETESTSGAWSNAITFHLRALITVPPSCAVATLRNELRELERGRKLDIVLEPVSARFEQPLTSTV